MKLQTKRRIDRVLIGAGVLAVGGAAVFGTLASNQERVEETQVHVVIDAAGSARVAEAIDYNFGATGERHGIFRDVPGLTAESDVEVSSPDAPDQFVLLGDRIKIGDPAQTVAGRHRYEITYTLVDVAPGGVLRFDGVGAGWDVPIRDVTIVVVGPYDWSGLSCDQGAGGTVGGCAATQVEPGRIEVRATDLGAHEGVTVSASSATPTGADAPTLPAFGPPPPDDSPGLLVPALVAMGAALVAAGGASLWVRRSGAEWVSGVGAADAAFPATLPPPPGMAPVGDAPVGDAPVGARRIDHADLADLATVDFAPPPGIGAAYGGIVLRESVRPEHKVAWLIEQVAAGSVALDDNTGDELLTVVSGRSQPLDPILAEAFGGRGWIKLGTYDEGFAAAWEHLGSVFEAWRDGSTLWDRSGDRTRTRALTLGILAAVAGLVLVGVGAFGGWLLVLALGGLLVGGGLAAALRSWELRVRTPAGSALWLRIESFRRFLAESEVQHVDWAVQHGLLRQYTAWAVAVGEIDRWDRALQASATARSVDPGAAHLAFLAPSLIAWTGSTAQAPSSSGSGGGGFSGGVGGGFGGGGGGSW